MHRELVDAPSRVTLVRRPEPPSPPVAAIAEGSLPVLVVLQDGQVVEHGSHDELIAAGGAYAELFELHARAYR